MAVAKVLQFIWRTHLTLMCILFLEQLFSHNVSHVVVFLVILILLCYFDEHLPLGIHVEEVFLFSAQWEQV